MNKFVVILLVVGLTCPAMVWAGEDRAFSDAQEKKIRKVIHDMYPNGIKIVMEDISGGQTRIVCWAKYSEDYFLFTASPGGNLQLNEIFPGNAHRTGIKMEENILQVLKPLDD